MVLSFIQTELLTKNVVEKRPSVCSVRTNLDIVTFRSIII